MIGVIGMIGIVFCQCPKPITPERNKGVDNMQMLESLKQGEG